MEKLKCTHAHTYTCTHTHTITFTLNRSTDYGRTFVNETYKFPSDAVAHWYYISKDSNKVCNRQNKICNFDKDSFHVLYVLM